MPRWPVGCAWAIPPLIGFVPGPLCRQRPYCYVYRVTVSPSRHPVTRQSASWATPVLGATAILLVVLLFASQVYLWVNWWPTKIGWATAIVWSLPQLAIWAGVIPIIAALGRRWPIEEPLLPARLVLHAMASVLLSLGGLLLLDFTDRAAHWSRLLAAPPSLLTSLRYTIIHLHMGIGIYWVTLAGVHALAYRKGLARHRAELTEVSEQLASAQLATLRAQLQPHFLFNTLNSIAVAIRQQPEHAEQMLHRLSDLLRTTLEAAELPEIPLADEIAAVDNYLAIERTRFGTRLKTTIQLSPDAAECLVPTFLLQPLVENAVRHAVSTRAAGGTIGVCAARSNGAVTITVRDDGPGVARLPTVPGVGLSNTVRRLAAHYGPMASFTLENHPEGGAIATLLIPARELPA